MNTKPTALKNVDSTSNTITTLGFYSALLTAIVTIITFGIAILTPPISGPLSAGLAIKYPYTDTISRFPRDFIWMFPAMLLMLLYVVLMICIYHYASKEKRIYGHIGLSFALISAVILLIDYFIQTSVIQPSLLNGELDSIGIFSQYNPHGIFISLEEIGYLTMAISFISIAPIFSRSNRLEKILRWVLVISFFLVVISLVLMSFIYGINREYRFEIAVITIDWLAMIVSSILLSIIFKKSARKA